MGEGERGGGEGRGWKGGEEEEGRGGGFGKTACVTESLEVKVLTGTGLPGVDGSNSPSAFVTLRF